MIVTCVFGSSPCDNWSSTGRICGLIMALPESNEKSAGTLTFSSTAYEVRALTITLTPATAPAAGDKFRVKVGRDANHVSEDTLAVDLLMLGYELYEETA